MQASKQTVSGTSHWRGPAPPQATDRALQIAFWRDALDIPDQDLAAFAELICCSPYDLAVAERGLGCGRSDA